MNKKDWIKIVDWTGRILFDGHYKDKEVDKVLESNRCECYYNDDIYVDYCANCDHTGYIGDFEIYWLDENCNDNVYECINY